MEREEIERAVDALLALSRANPEERQAAVAALDARVRDIRSEAERVDGTHSLVRFMLDAIPFLALVRHLAANALRAAEEHLPERDREWTYGKIAKRYGITRASAQEIVRRSRSKLPKV